MESDRDGEFSKEVDHWYKADLDGNKILNSTEFLAFIHPEHNKRTLQAMVEEMMPSFDKNGDKVGKRQRSFYFFNCLQGEFHFHIISGSISICVVFCS